MAGVAILTVLLGACGHAEQGPPRTDSTGPRLADPPCAAPAGGWATSALNELSTGAVAAYRRQFPYGRHLGGDLPSPAEDVGRHDRVGEPPAHDRQALAGLPGSALRRMVAL